MKAQVRLFALYRELAGANTVEVCLPQGGTVADLLKCLGQQIPRLGFDYRSTLVAVNAEYALLEQRIQEGDDIVLIPPVSGGAHIRITTEPLDARAIAQRVRRDTNGAVVTFEGTTRRFTSGQEVLRLEYEAFVPMAEKKMAQIADEIRDRWAIQDVAMEHRVGRVEIGETSLVVAVASPHRRAAFAAAHYAVDRIKQEVPIWKKEFFADGAVWVGSEGEPQSAKRQRQDSI